MRALSDPGRQTARPAGSVLLALLGLALLAAPAVLVIQDVRDAPSHPIAVAVAGALLAVLVVWRFALIVRSLERMRAEQLRRLSSSWTVNRNGETARIVVADTGIGISPRDQDRLFERFYRAPNAVEKQIPGTGLGLYIARAIAEGHGGRITVSSKNGNGSRFTVALPVSAS